MLRYHTYYQTPVTTYTTDGIKRQCVGIHCNIHATYGSYWLQRSAPSLCLDTGGYWLKSGNGAAYPPKPWVLWCPSLFRSFETTSQPCCPTQITTGLARTSQSQHVVPSVLNIHHLALEIWWEENLLWVLYLSGIGSQIDLPKLMNQVLAVVRKSLFKKTEHKRKRKKQEGKTQCKSPCIRHNIATQQTTTHRPTPPTNTTQHTTPRHITQQDTATRHILKSHNITNQNTWNNITKHNT